jgi:hypothetical protein
VDVLRNVQVTLIFSCVMLLLPDMDYIGRIEKKKKNCVENDNNRVTSGKESSLLGNLLSHQSVVISPSADADKSTQCCQKLSYFCNSKEEDFVLQ